VADNLTTQSATPATVPASTVIATDDVGGVHYQLVKLAFGALDTATLVATGSGLPISDAGGSLTVDNSGTFAVQATQSGTWNVGVTGSVAVTGPLTDAQLRAAAVPISDGAGSITVDNAGTFAVQASQSGTWAVRNQDGTGNALTSRTAGSVRPLDVAIVDGSGNQITSFGGSGGTASAVASAVPGTATAAGFSDGTNMQLARLFDADSGGGTQYVLGVQLRATGSGGSTEIGTAAAPVRTDPTGTTTQPVSDGGGSLTVDGSVTVSGTVTANLGTIGAVATESTLSTLNTKVTACNTGAVVLAAGTANIGDVDVLTLPAIPAGTNLIGQTASGLQTNRLLDGTTALTPKYASISTASSGNTTAVAAVTSKKIRVLSYRFQSDGDVSVKFRSATAGDITGAMATGAKGGGGGASFSPVGHFETVAGEALQINLSAAVQVSGHLVYVEV
jgi:hypothetical protein